MMKKIALVIVTVCFIFFCFWGQIFREQKTNPDPSLYVTEFYKGTVVLYHQDENDSYFVLNVIYNDSRKKFKFEEDTVWYSSEIKEQMLNKTTDIDVTVVTTYRPDLIIDDIYPVAWIDPY